LILADDMIFYLLFLISTLKIGIKTLIVFLYFSNSFIFPILKNGTPPPQLLFEFGGKGLLAKDDKKD